MKRVIPFTKVRGVTYTLSLVVLAAMFVITFVVHGGFNLGIDFQPGVSVQAVVKGADTAIDKVRAALVEYDSAQVQSFTSDDGAGYVIRVRNIENKDGFDKLVESQIRADLAKVFGAGNVQVGSGDGLSTNSIGARFAQSLTQQTFLLVGLALILILIYVWFRFKLAFGVAAIVATIHDTLFMIAFIGATSMEITSATIAAVLTIIGYSLNDTIVVFDRIRENEKIMAEHKLSHIYDSSISTTLSRTICTSLTTLLAIISIAIFTQGEVQDFAEALIVGIVVGTYSSIFIAAPVLLDWKTTANRRKAKLEASGVVVKADGQEYDGETPVNTTEVDADAVAEEIRKTRADKKKF